MHPKEAAVLWFALGLFHFEPTEVEEEESLPTNARPGSQEKIDILQFRLEIGLPLFHPCDLALRPDTEDITEIG